MHKTVVDLIGEFVLKIINNEMSAWDLCIVIARVYNNDEAEINDIYHSVINDTQLYQQHKYFTKNSI
jgi:hypothetical protein